MLEGVFSKKSQQKDKNKNKKSTDVDSIILNLEDQMTEREGVKVKCLSIMCTELDDHFLHKIMKFFQMLKDDEKLVYIILHITSGGLSSDCTIISRIFRDYLSRNETNRIVMVVPEIAVSTGSYLALNGSQLIMGRLAHITPFDDQFREMGVKQLQRIMRNKDKYNIKGLTLKECDAIVQSKNMRKITKKEIDELLTYQKYNVDTIKNVKNLFLKHKLYHTYPITISMVRDTGLKVDELSDPLIENAFDELYEVCMI